MATMVKSMALEGIEGFPVEIEAATIRGQQQMVSIIGLGDQAVKEAGERIQAAITCYGYDLPKDNTIGACHREQFVNKCSRDLTGIKSGCKIRKIGLIVWGERRGYGIRVQRIM